MGRECGVAFESEKDIANWVTRCLAQMIGCPRFLVDQKPPKDASSPLTFCPTAEKLHACGCTVLMAAAGSARGVDVTAGA